MKVGLIMSKYDQMFGPKVILGHCDLYFMVQCFCLISSSLRNNEQDDVRLLVNRTQCLTPK